MTDEMTEAVEADRGLEESTTGLEGGIKCILRLKRRPCALSHHCSNGLLGPEKMCERAADPGEGVRRRRLSQLVYPNLSCSDLTWPLRLCCGSGTTSFFLAPKVL